MFHISKSMLRVLAGYAFAAASVSLAFLLTKAMTEELAGQLSPLFFAAVAASAWYGGLGPGLFATTVSGIATAFFFMVPTNSIGVDDPVRFGAFLMVAVLISSINEKERRAQRALVEACATAAAANRTKDEFLAVLSHELRNPLNAVLSAVAVAERRSPAEPVGDLLAVVRRNAELEARLIDDLLDLTRLSKGKLTVVMEPVDAHEVVRHATEVCARDIENKDLKVHTHFNARESVVHADPARLEQVVWNLLRNSVKFTPHGGCVTIRSFNVDGALRLEVADTGIGIGRETLPKVFSAFEQGGERVTRQFGGLGLGLSICKRLVELHGGRISAHSEGRGRGATFAVELPVWQGRDSAVEAPLASGSDLSRMGRELRILLVEDHADTAMLLRQLLEGVGHKVTTVGGVSAALAAAAADEFDLVISDIGLPDGNGRDLMQELRSRGRVRGIALSGYGSDRDVRKSIDAGFAQHLTKPVNFEQLLAAIQEVCASEAEERENPMDVVPGA